MEIYMGISPSLEENFKGNKSLLIEEGSIWA